MHISCTGAHVAGFFNCEIWIHLNMISNCSKISCIVKECQSDHEWFRLVQHNLSHNIYMTHLISRNNYLPDHFVFQQFYWRLHLWNPFSSRKYVLMFLISLMWIILCDRIVTMLSKQILSIMRYAFVINAKEWYPHAIQEFRFLLYTRYSNDYSCPS